MIYIISYITQVEIFVSEALPKKLLDFIKDNNINIDYSKLEDSIEKVEELYKTEDDISEILYNKKDGNKIVDEYYEKIDKLQPYTKIRKDETIRIIKYLRKNTKDPR